MSAAADMTPAEVDRLSLIRYQLLSATEALQQPAPINSLAINLMQDVVESTLGAVGEHIRAEIKARSDFDKLFDAVVGKLGAPAELTGLRSAAVALNNARVGFKHHGNQVRDETLRRHHDVAVTLVHGLVHVGFGIELDEVSMLSFIYHDGVRGFLEKAEALRAENELIRALSYLRAAFDLAIDDYANRKSVDGWYSIFKVEPGLTSHISTFNRTGWEEPYGKLREWVKGLDARIRLAAIGVDLSRYAYFDAVAPVLTYLIGDERGPAMSVRFENVTDDHFRASYLFVVDTAMKLASHDFNLVAIKPTRRSVQGYDPEFFSEKYLQDAREDAARIADWKAQQNSDGSATGREV